MHGNAWKRKAYYPSHFKVGCTFSGCKSSWIQWVSCVWGLTPLHEIWWVLSAVCFNHLKTISFIAFLFFFFNNNYCMIYNVTTLTALQPCESLAYFGQCFALCSQEMAVGSERAWVHMGSRWCWCCFHKSCLGGRGEKQLTLITGMTCWMLVPGVSASEHN